MNIRFDEPRPELANHPDRKVIIRTRVRHNDRFGREQKRTDEKKIQRRTSGGHSPISGGHLVVDAPLQLAGHTVDRFVQLGNFLRQVLPASDEPVGRSVGRRAAGDERDRWASWWRLSGFFGNLRSLCWLDRRHWQKIANQQRPSGDDLLVWW